MCCIYVLLYVHCNNISLLWWLKPEDFEQNGDKWDVWEVGEDYCGRTKWLQWMRSINLLYALRPLQINFTPVASRLIMWQRAGIVPSPSGQRNRQTADLQWARYERIWNDSLLFLSQQYFALCFVCIPLNTKAKKKKHSGHYVVKNVKSGTRWSIKNLNKV